jgi:hypothetical protein
MIPALTLDVAQCARQRIVRKHYVAVGEQQPIPRRSCRSTRHRMRLAQPSGCQLMHMLDHVRDTRLTRRLQERIHRCTRLIRRPVIDGNHLQFHAFRREQ